MISLSSKNMLPPQQDARIQILGIVWYAIDKKKKKKKKKKKIKLRVILCQNDPGWTLVTLFKT